LQLPISKKKGSKDDAATIGERGMHTSRLLLKAMEVSGSSPWVGTMNLRKEDTKGTAAFLRSVSNYIYVENPFDYQRTIEGEEYQTFVRRKEEKRNQNNFSEMREENFLFSKADINPLVLFLHVDQGCYATVGYTPFSTPRANNCTVHKEHVVELCKELQENKNVLSSEDFSIIGFNTEWTLAVMTNQASDSESDEGSESEGSENKDEPDKNKVDKEKEDSSNISPASKKGRGSESESERKMDDKAKEDSSNISHADKTNLAAEALIELENNTGSAEHIDEVSYIPQPMKCYGMKYLCILNRDKMSDKTIQGKTAVAFDLDDYENSLRSVSVQCSWFK
jgi:hypothetical protein